MTSFADYFTLKKKEGCEWCSVERSREQNKNKKKFMIEIKM